MGFGIRGGDDVVVSFLSLHLPVSDASIALAEDFLDTLFPEPIPEFRDGGTLGDVLEEVVAGISDAHPGSKVVIPLTEGLDSRSILGAALRVVGRERILCCTMGERRNFEVLAAQEVCRRNGIRHVRFDPAEHCWDAGEIVAHAAAAFETYRSFCSVDSVLLTGLNNYCRQAYGEDFYILSGFLGDVASGAHLRMDLATGGLDAAIAVFLEQNRTYRDYAPSERVRTGIAVSGRRMHERLKARGYAGVTLFDTLDIALRQGLRIRGGLHKGEATVYAPYADARIFSWWYGPPARERLGQIRYRRELAGRYPGIFCLPDDKVRRTGVVTRPRRTLWTRVAGRIRAQFSPVRDTSTRGDLRIHAQKREVILDLVRSFGERRLVDLDTGALIRSDFVHGVQRMLKAVATVETHLRAGTLQRLQEGPVVPAGRAGLPAPWRP